MNCISGGRVRWEVIRQEGIKTYIACIIKKRDTTKQCRVFKDHLEQLVKSGHLKEFVVVPKGNAVGQASRTQGSTLPLSLGVIEVIFVASMSTNLSRHKGVLSVVSVENFEGDTWPREEAEGESGAD